jgi:hypothetical protein
MQKADHVVIIVKLRSSNQKPPPSKLRKNVMKKQITNKIDAKVNAYFPLAFSESKLAKTRV